MERLKGLRSDLSAHLQKNEDDLDAYKSFEKDFTKVDKMFDKKRVEHHQHDEKPIADSFQDLQDLGTQMADENEKKRREQLQEQLRNLERELTVVRESEAQEIEEAAEVEIQESALKVGPLMV